MGIPFYHVDAFSRDPFRGNPAAVVLLDHLSDAVWMQTVARELASSEAAFVARRNGGYDIRWFTPAVEVALCGHATLAAAHTLWESGRVSAGEPIRFSSMSGPLGAVREDDWVMLDFPVRRAQTAVPPPALIQAIGVEPLFVGMSQDDYLLHLPSEESVRSLNPDLALLKTLPVRGMIVTAASTSPDHDFVSRFFAPGVGIDEDPVTGSAHCCLGPFWQRELGKNVLTGYQASARGGVVRVRVEGERVFLGGRAVTIIRGELASRPA